MLINILVGGNNLTTIMSLKENSEKGLINNIFRQTEQVPPELAFSWLQLIIGTREIYLVIDCR